ncbi:hypothetical protein EV356DRAFT_514238 [Viridothelium virens]|uniref:Uncharacterized protein n=1 Tax=Viridothelium virens TaxID=1048519 RepID=A0A6A6HD49_VIRVR|nr:hypothetical protein EV356DRAFT_514238 [Viridothelium virens]
MNRLKILRSAPSTFSGLPFRPRASNALPLFRPSLQNPFPIQSQTSPFSSTACLLKRKKQRVKQDIRVRHIKFHLAHPITPRPLRFSRHRALRHWTIHRAWHTHLSQVRRARELDLERQYESMKGACEALRTLGEDGIGYTIARAPEPNEDGTVPLQKAQEGGEGLVVIGGSGKGEGGKELGRLYRLAMEKKGIWQGVPIEYARIQTDTPGREGWDHGWKR